MGTTQNFSLLFFILCFSIAFTSTPSISIASDKTTPWTGRLGDGTSLASDDFREIVLRHKDWLDSNGAKGIKADFSNADLSGIDLEKIRPLTEDIAAGRLAGINLAKSNFAGAILAKANLTCSNFSEANFSRANLAEANFSGANLTKANMPHTNLYKTNLGGANLYNADLSYAQFNTTDMDGATLTNAILNYATYESVVHSPSPSNIGGIKGLDTLTFNTSDGYSGLALLRSSLRLAGLRESERQLTLSIERGRLHYKDSIERYTHLILFYLPCSYGESPLRPIFILALLTPLFATIYYFSITRGTNKNNIYIIWPDERIQKNIGSKTPTRVSSSGIAAVGWAFYFSILSASRIGWRDLNLGSWIVNLQRREYLLKAIGWTRTISGIQSLISVYLLALSVLTYFGRPFE
ncbi:MAG: putative low-complexity protein [Solidesulfovibrio magneticus str. Maddingley MBC34]|uniref:Putative low-complexity protein n=1 Tax=Solidesulfovibrio magneticus str. Maddingley MBC34 TaxID=1206767 RepID=K6GBW0_9BACT|nr:MAG: putative low-complexity protein [Solidesulfovibrio magneticus str. Maddingley MBC34]